MSKSRSFACLLLMLSAAVACADSVYFPVFEKANVFSPVIGVVSSDAPARTTGALRRTFSNQHPLAWVFDMAPCELPNGQGFVSPDVRTATPTHPERNFPVRHSVAALDFMLCVCPLALLALAGLVLYRKWRGPQLSSGEAATCALGVIVLARIFLLAWMCSEAPYVIPSAADDNGYFATAQGMLSGHWRGPWSFTVGNGFFYMPFILLLKARTFYDIAIPYDYFSGFVLGPMILICGFFLLRKLKIGYWNAFAAMLLLAAWPFFVFHLENWQTLNFPAYVAWPNVAQKLHHFYRIMIGTGFNAMSDTPSVLLILICAMMAVTVKKHGRNAVFLGILFGFTCMVRINNIFYAPLLAFLALEGFTWKKMISASALAAAGFLFGFGLQFAVNIYQFGNPMTFGYVLHYPHLPLYDRPMAGFTWHTLARGAHIKFLCGANLPMWSFGIAGLLCLQSTRLRTVLALWSVPVILFFFGYSHTFCDAIRFVMPTQLAFLGAFFALWDGSPKAWRHGLTACGIALALLLIGNAYLTASLLCVILLRGVFDAVHLMRPTLFPSKKSTGAAGAVR